MFVSFELNNSISKNKLWGYRFNDSLCIIPVPVRACDMSMKCSRIIVIITIILNERQTECWLRRTWFIVIELGLLLLCWYTRTYSRPIDTPSLSVLLIWVHEYTITLKRQTINSTHPTLDHLFGRATESALLCSFHRPLSRIVTLGAGDGVSVCGTEARAVAVQCRERVAEWTTQTLSIKNVQRKVYSIFAPPQHHRTRTPSTGVHLCSTLATGSVCLSSSALPTPIIVYSLALLSKWSNPFCI